MERIKVERFRAQGLKSLGCGLGLSCWSPGSLPAETLALGRSVLGFGGFPVRKARTFRGLGSEHAMA